MAFRLIAVVTLTAGTIFLMWLGEQITERGLGNGISIIIFAGIAAGLPHAIGGTLEFDPYRCVLDSAGVDAVCWGVVGYCLGGIC